LYNAEVIGNEGANYLISTVRNFGAVLGSL